MSATIDQVQLNELQELLEEDFAPLIETYFTDSQTRLDLIKQALDTHNNLQGFEAVHALKGANANIGATHLTALCLKLQMACKAGTIGQQAELIDAIVEEQHAVFEYLRQLLAQSS